MSALLCVITQQYETFTFQDRGYTDWWFDAGAGTGKTFIACRLDPPPNHVAAQLRARVHWRERL